MKDREAEFTETEGMPKDSAKDMCIGDHIIDVECGLNKAVLHLDRLCQGSKGACILFEETWMTPNEFQAASGRETAKDWKRSIKHHDKSLKLLMIKGVFSTEPAACSCDYCTGTELPPSPPLPQNASVTKDTRKKRAAVNDDETKEVIRARAKCGRKKRKKSKSAAPVVRLLRRRSAPVSRRFIPRASPRTSTRASSKAGRRTIDGASDRMKENSESGSEESENEEEGSSDEAEESLPLADVKKGLGIAKGKKTAIADVAPVICGKGRRGRKPGRKAQPPRGDHVSVCDRDVTRNSEIQTNSVDNNVDEPKAMCLETAEKNEATLMPLANGGNRECADIGKTAHDAPERQDASKTSSLSETDVANESSSQTDSNNSKTFKIESERHPQAAKETIRCLNGSELYSASRKENDVTAPGVPHSVHTDIMKAEKGQSRLGCGAPREVAFEAPAAAPQADKSVEDTEPANGNTAVATSAAIPTPNDSDSAIDTESGVAHDNASLPKQERNVTANDNIASTNDRSPARTDDHAEQDGADEDGELPSPKREARLMSIIQELKTYKKRLVTKIEAKKRTTVTGLSPSRDDDSPCPIDTTKEEPDNIPSDMRDSTTVALDCQSQVIPPSSSSPLQQLLFDPSVHPLPSPAAQPLAGTTSRVPGKRRRTWNRRQVSYSTPDEGLLAARAPALNHAVNCNGVVVDGSPNAVVAYCFDSPAQTEGVTGPEHSALLPGKLSGFTTARSYDVANRGADDKCLLKIPKRCNANIAVGSARDRSAMTPLLDLSAQKRKSSSTLPEVATKKQRGSWQMHGIVNAGMNGSRNSFVTSVSSVPSMSAVSLSDGSRTAKPRGDLHAASVSKAASAGYSAKSSRRPHISAWSADDVFAFVLSTPHASIYAKEFLEHRITGRVLQNLTAIQMMRILRIGEHAAHAVRTTVEKLLEMTPALTQGVRR